MTHKEQVDAIRLSLLLADTRADRRLGIPRKPAPLPPKPLPVYLREDPTGFAPGCLVDWVPPHE